MEDVLAQLEAAQAELEPQFKALRGVMSALRTATRLAAADKADALPMYKALTKLDTAAAPIENGELGAAVSAFASATQTALDNLALSPTPAPNCKTSPRPNSIRWWLACKPLPTRPPPASGRPG